MIIGITGISGSGKTEVTRILASLGGFTVETDPLAHALMKKGQAAYSEIVATFGTGILREDGEIFRPALGLLVFDDRGNMSQLEAILHPKVSAATMDMIANAENYPFAVIDAPLLIEAGMHKLCDSCWLVTASHETRLARIIARDNITPEAATKRLAARIGDEALKPHVDVIIENNDNDLAILRTKVADALRNVTNSP